MSGKITAQRGLRPGGRRTPLMARSVDVLTVLQVENAKPGQRLSDGGGLRLDVDKNGNSSWIFRFRSPITGRERFMGLGPSRDVSLAQARDAAQEARSIVRQGLDPIDQRKERRVTIRVAAVKSITFRCREIRRRLEEREASTAVVE